MRRDPINSTTTEENQNDDPGREDGAQEAVPATTGPGARQRLEACRIVGYSRQHFCEIGRNFQVHGAEGLVDRLPGAKGPHPNRVAPPIEKAILAHALNHPTHGAQRVADELMLRGAPT